MSGTLCILFIAMNLSLRFHNWKDISREGANVLDAVIRNPALASATMTVQPREYGVRMYVLQPSARARPVIFPFSKVDLVQHAAEQNALVCRGCDLLSVVCRRAARRAAPRVVNTRCNHRAVQLNSWQTRNTLFRGASSFSRTSAARAFGRACRSSFVRCRSEFKWKLIRTTNIP